MSKKIDDKKTRPGVEAPVVSGRPGLKTTAWRNLDQAGAKPNYHVIIQLRGQDDFEMLSLTPERIKALGEQLLDIHAQIRPETK